MRIALFHNLPSGGAKRAAIEMARFLRASGDSVDVFVPSTADERFLPFSEVANSVEMFEAAGSPETGGKRSWLPRFGRELRIAERVQKRIAAAIDKRSYDLAFVHHCRFVQAPWILRYLQTPSAYYCQEPYRVAYEALLEPTAALSRLRLWLPGTGIATIDRINASHARLILANSFFSRESILRAYGRDSEVVYLGVDPQTFKPGSAPREHYVLSVGALAPFKGHRHVIGALGLIPEHRRPALMIVADRQAAGEETVLRALAEERRVDLSLRLGINEAELVAAYQRATLVVSASYLEPFGLASLEAAACGTPVIGIREGGHRETVIDGLTGVLVPDRRPRSLADTLDALLSDVRRLAAMRDTSVETIRSAWTWNHTGKQLRIHLAHLAHVATPALDP